jgi:hypothetical protein
VHTASLSRRRHLHVWSTATCVCHHALWHVNLSLAVWLLHVARLSPSTHAAAWEPRWQGRTRLGTIHVRRPGQVWMCVDVSDLRQALVALSRLAALRRNLLERSCCSLMYCAMWCVRAVQLARVACRGRRADISFSPIQTRTQCASSCMHA